MTQEHIYYKIKGYYGKGPRAYLERIISLSLRDEDHPKLLDEAGKDFMEEWPAIKMIKWEKL